MKLNTKLMTAVALFLHFALFTAILVAGLLFYQAHGQLNLPGLTEKNSTGLTLSASEIAKHNSPTDCWMIIDSKVYDFTKFLAAHPGGAGSMLGYCGKDGSSAYQTKDKTPARAHSNYAVSLLSQYYLGDLNQQISTPAPATNQPPLLNPPVQNTPPAQPQLNISSLGDITLSPAEVARHNSQTDCWMIIDGKVYDLTSFLAQHPGGAGTMLPYCGADGSAAYATKDRNPARSHSSYAVSLLASYYVGDLNQKLSAAAVQQKLNQTAQAPPVTGGDDNDYEQEND